MDQKESELGATKCKAFDGDFHGLEGKYLHADMQHKENLELGQLTLRNVELSSDGTEASGKYDFSSSAPGANSGIKGSGSFQTGVRSEWFRPPVPQLELDGFGYTWDIRGVNRDASGRITRLCLQKEPGLFSFSRPYAMKRIP